MMRIKPDVMLDQNKGYSELTSASNASSSVRAAGGVGLMRQGPLHVVSMRNRWVGKHRPVWVCAKPAWGRVLASDGRAWASG